MPRYTKYTKWMSPLAFVALLAVFSFGCSKAARASRHLARGARELASGRYDSAEIEYLKVLQIAPLDAVALRQLGTIYQQEGRWPGAYALLKKSLELSPEDLQGHFQMSLTCFCLENRKLAAQEAGWVLRVQPGHEEALELLADCCTGPGETQAIQSQLEKLGSQDKDVAGYHVAMSTLYLKRHELANAQKEALRALELDPRSAGVRIALGNLRWATNDLSGADQAFQSAAEVSPLRSPRRLKYAQFKLSIKDVAAAKAILRQITDQAPDYLPAWNLQAELALAEQHFDECDNDLARVLARDRLNYDGLLLHARLILAKGDTAKAVAEFERMAAVYDHSPQVQLELARAYLSNGDTVKSSTQLQRAIGSDPRFTDAILLLATINLRRGDTSSAIASLNELVKKQPEVPQAYLLLANAYLTQKDPDQAINVCQQMQKRFPNSPEVLLVLGTVLAKERHPEEARRSFERALQLAPNYLPALEQIVDLDLADGNYAVAIDRATQQINRQPGAALPWLLLAKVHLSKARSYLQLANGTAGARSHAELDFSQAPAAQPDINEAESELLKSLTLDPGLRTSYLMLANLYVSCNKQRQALERLDQFLSKTNDLTAQMQVGMIQDRLKDYSAARDAYEKVLAINPSFGLALNNLAYLYSERFSDMAKAYRMAERARQALPDDPSVADTLGWILYKREEYQRALGIIEEAATKLSEDPEIQFHLGMAHYMLLDEDLAKAALQRACQDGNGFPGKDEARQRLRLLSLDTGRAGAATVSELEGYLREHPGDPMALCRMGEIRERIGATDEALQDYQAALKRSPQNPRVLLRLANLYCSGRSPDNKKALGLAKQAHELAPDDPRVSALLGRLVLASGDSKWSASLLEESARKLPGDPDVAYDLAWSYYSLGQVADAQAAMLRAETSATPGKSEQAKRFVTFVSATSDPSKVEALQSDAQRVLLAEPDYVPGLMLMALIQDTHANYQQAAELYERILAVYPLFGPAKKNLALLCFQRLGKDSRAYELAVNARIAFPQDAQIAKVLGILEYRKAHYPRASQLLRESAQNRPDDPELFYFLGKTLYQLNANSESRAAFQQALALKLKPPSCDDARRLVQELK